LVNNDYEFLFFVGYLLTIILSILLLPLIFHLFAFSTPSNLKFKHQIAHERTKCIFNRFKRKFFFFIPANFNNVIKVIYGIFRCLDKYIRMFHYFSSWYRHNFSNQLPMFLTGPFLGNDSI